MLIPKRSGDGWLAVPASHHACDRTSELQSVSGCDVCGLDGTLDFEVDGKVSTYPDKQVEFEAKIFPTIEKLFHCKAGKRVSYGTIVDLIFSKRKLTSQKPVIN